MTTRKQNAFTIVELLVAMALLVMMLSLSGLIFSTTVKAHRAATATVDISRHLTAVTSQITSDLDGLRKNAPLFIRFDHRANNRRFDAIHFFAGGDFQTTKQYPVRWDSDGDGVLETSDDFRNETIRGTLARIYYGHANSVDFLRPPVTADFLTFQVLARKAHILTSYDALTFDAGEIPVVTAASGNPMYAPFAASFGLMQYPNPNPKYTVENGWEFNTITLDQWINALNYKDGSNPPVNANHFIDHCMANNSRPYVNLSDNETLHLLMAQGAMSFSVQWAYTPEDLNGAVTGFTNGVRWWPSRDPNGDGDDKDSDFGSPVMNKTAFGAHFNLAAGTTAADWFAVQNCCTANHPLSPTARIAFKSTFYPKALKFTFTLRDGNGYFADGKTFTHIVYLDN